MPVELFIQMENSKGSILAANYAAHTPSSLEPNGNRKKFSLMRYFTQTYRNFIMKLVVMKPKSAIGFNNTTSRSCHGN